MPDTPSTKYGIDRPADGDSIRGWPATIRSAIDKIDALMATISTVAPRPAAGLLGRFHRAADGTVSLDTGGSWDEIARHPHGSKHAAGGSDPLTVSQAMLAADVALVPVGSIIAFAGQNLPANGRFAWADGSMIDRTIYTEFFATVGHSFNGGIDPGGNLVRLPDLRGRVPVGVDGAAARLTATDALGQGGGEEKHTLSAGELAAHTHADGTLTAASDGAHQHDIGSVNQGGGTFTEAGGRVVSTIGGGSGGITIARGTDGGFYIGLIAKTAGAHTHDVTGSTASAGGGGAHNNMPPYQVVNYLVRIL